MGAHPVHRLPQQAHFHQSTSEATPVLVGQLEGYPGQQKAVKGTSTHHDHCEEPLHQHLSILEV